MKRLGNAIYYVLDRLDALFILVFLAVVLAGGFISGLLIGMGYRGLVDGFLAYVLRQVQM